ncbi:MAG: helix-turn-helix domain-containing protein [Blastocatellia bacterium]|nr:helix-turn-helix domain-containing protein [Blastocatellia bacterium]
MSNPYRAFEKVSYKGLISKSGSRGAGRQGDTETRGCTDAGMHGRGDTETRRRGERIFLFHRVAHSPRRRVSPPPRPPLAASVIARGAGITSEFGQTRSSYCSNILSMIMDTDACYRAMRSRDRRFDGRFYTAVVTTGIYCRPVCPAPTPERRNVRFFDCAAAAEEAGFRPCRRCRPETAPGTPAWLGKSATIARALRLIAEGALDEGSLEELAERLGIGSRHLRRLFHEEIGASPSAVAQTRRVHFARKLLDETKLPIAEVALSSGFGSIRRFNEVMRRSFGMTPTGLRSGARKKSAPPAERGVDSLRRSYRAGEFESGNGALSLRLPFRPPFDWESILCFLGSRAIPGVELVTQSSYSRAFTLAGTSGILKLRPSEPRDCLYLTVSASETRGLNRIVERARKLFDCDADPLQISECLSKDARLAPLLRARPGLRVPGAIDAFELGMRAVLGQQITVRAATTLAGRLVQAFGVPLGDYAEEGITHLFPTPDVLAEADLTTIGLTRPRAAAIAALAKFVLDDPLALESVAGLNETIERLTRIPGIGSWTANYIAMRAAGEPDAFPSGDLALRRAASAGGEMISVKELEQRAEAWRPWRAYAAMHLWASLR